MHIIPVIDLMNGQVVQAVQGQRQHYQPIKSRLTDSHYPLDVIAAILQVYAFDCLYIADLNAITCNQALPNHKHLIQEAISAFPQIHWWVDAGIQHVKELEIWLEASITPILGSESISDLETYHDFFRTAPHGILSLDFFLDGFRGPQTLLEVPDQWTQPTIIMNLPNVGARNGPALDKIRALKQNLPYQRLYAAGGVRHMADIKALEQTGAEGVLVASALHQKQLFF